MRQGVTMAVWASVAFVIASLSLAAGVRENVARNKPAWMSTTRKTTQSAGNAVDGVTTANHERYSIHTSGSERTAWWKVDLQTQVQSAQVIIYFRTDYMTRRNGLQLYTSVTNSSEPKGGSLCHTVTGRPNGTDIPGVLNVTCPGTWRYLTVYTETDNDGVGVALDFAEVEVWNKCQKMNVNVTATSCTSGYYGSNCEQRCDARQCKMTSSCDVQGQCVGECAAGYQGTDCIQACTRGMYGPDCARECSSRHCKTRPSTCDIVTGRCPDGCEDGWTEIDCTRNCADGLYGNNCSLKCADRHCTSTSCLGDGACSAGCEVGWTLQDCTQECPSGSYGRNCESTCGHCADNKTCHHVSGTCPVGCQAGWELPLCQTGCDNGKFGVNCERHCDHCNGTCDAVDGRCLWGCAEGYTGSQCAVKRESQRCSAITPTTAGIIGLAAGICFMLILGVGLYVGLVRKWRLQWISSSEKDAVEVKETQVPVDKDTTQPSDNYTSISEQAGGRNIYNNDYAALDVEAKANNDYDVIKNQAYENL